ncbi:MAG: hypothetical protein ACLFTK_17035, partial [Anaerolineales bacterium]
MPTVQKLFVILLILLLIPAPLSAQDDGIDAAPSIGDPFAPDLGNAGIDVQTVLLELDANPAGPTIAGTATLDIRLTLDDVISFSLDLRQQMTVNAVRVAGDSVPWTH